MRELKVEKPGQPDGMTLEREKADKRILDQGIEMRHTRAGQPHRDSQGQFAEHDFVSRP